MEEVLRCFEDEHDVLSMNPRTLADLLRDLDPRDDGLRKVHIFDRSFNTPDHDAEKAWATKRDLAKVWDDPAVRAAGFTAGNTLLVETDPRKAKDWVRNTLIMPAFGPDAADAMTRTHSAAAAPACDLRALQRYIQNVVLPKVVEGSLVPHILTTNPFPLAEN